MRVMIGTLLAGAAMLSACGEKAAEKRAQADAKAAGFVPPSVTSRLDYGGAMERRFRALDRNADDRIDRTEMPTRTSRLWTFDRNRDGVVTSSEFGEGTLARFDAMDLNHDGTVTSEERAAWRKQGGR